MKSRYKLQGESLESYFNRCLADAQERLEATERWEQRPGAGSVSGDAKGYAEGQVNVYADVVKLCN